MKKTIDIIIVTKDRPDRLFSCVSRIVEGSVKPNRIIIIDSSKVENYHPFLINRLCESAKIKLDHIKIIHRGIAYSRNRGLERVGSEIVGFIDDDEIMCEDWIKIALESFIPTVNVVTGVKIPSYPNNYWNSIWGEIYRFEQTLGDKRVFISAGNSCFRIRYLKERNLSFDQNLEGKTSEDWIMSYKLKNLGCKIHVNQRLIVRHECRITFASFVHQWFTYGKGSYHLASKYFIHPNTNIIRRNISIAKVFIDSYVNFFSFSIKQKKLVVGFFIRDISFSGGFLFSWMTGIS